jgi:nicotinamide-nucleotide amidase
MSALKDLMLQSPRLTLGIAESLTCGRVQAKVGEISGASDFFRGGVTAYTLDEKVRHLGVDRALAKRTNSVSATIAEQMARGACALFGSDVGVSTTGYAEPSADDDVPEPFAWWAIAHRRRPFGRRRAGGKFVHVASGRVDCPGATRVDTQAKVAETVVVQLIAYLRRLRE